MEWNFTYENQGTNAFLVFPLESTDELDNMGIGMISNNHIPHILPISFMQVDENRYLRYSISSKISLDNFFSGMVSKKRLLNVFIGICEAIEAGSEYMLESDMLVLDKRYIFANVVTGEPDLVYLPILKQGEALDLGRFFKEIMFSTQFDSGEDCGYVAEIINHLNTNANFSLKGFKTLLYTVRNQGDYNSQPLGQLSGPLTQSFLEKSTEKEQTTAAQPKLKAAPAQAKVPPAPQRKPPEPPKKPQPAMPTVHSLPTPQNMPKEEKKKYGLFGKTEKKIPETAPVPTPGFAVPTMAVPGMEGSVSIPKPPQPEKKENATSKKLFGFGKLSDKGNTNQLPETSVLNVPPQNPPAPSGFKKAEVQPAAWAKSNTVPQYGQTSVLNAEIGQTTVLSAGGAQTVMSETAFAEREVPRPVLLRNRTGQKIQIDKLLFRIGTEQSFVDFWVSDNSAVSHSHADIINHEGNYFVRDNNSTNHTYLNGELLTSNQEYSLTTGDKLTLGNEEFEFVLK